MAAKLILIEEEKTGISNLMFLLQSAQNFVKVLSRQWSNQADARIPFSESADSSEHQSLLVSEQFCTTRRTLEEKYELVTFVFD